MFTKYSDINQLLSEFKAGILSILGEDVLGIYLFGSLTYGDFEPSRSDIDLSIIIKQFLTSKQISDVRNLHQDIEKIYPKWKGRLECSYTPKDMFNSQTPPGDRPYWGESELYIGTYGNEWIINNYLLQEHSIILHGVAFNTFCPTISISQVKSACLSDLQKEWTPKLHDDVWLSNSHYQSYLVLNLCRILHTVKNNKASSKKVSAIWVKNNFPKWTLLIDKALSWHYGEIMNQTNTTKEFLSFILEEAFDSI